MGEYILYVNGKTVGGVYDNRLLVKKSAGVRALMPDAPEELPYPGAKPMLRVTEVYDRAFLEKLFEALDGDIPEKKNKAKKK